MDVKISYWNMNVERAAGMWGVKERAWVISKCQVVDSAITLFYYFINFVVDSVCSVWL